MCEMCYYSAALLSGCKTNNYNTHLNSSKVMHLIVFDISVKPNTSSSM